ncbi:MAG: PIG-L family deacetylase [Gemmatimonadota bacterium]
MKRWFPSAAAYAAALVAGASVVAPLASASLGGGTLLAQGPTPDRGAAALGSTIASLGVTGRVLTIAAHPDDEDTQFITWLTRGQHVETAYLSLTRGDGGQNLIGNELGEALGVIRTQELLAARRIDGGRQYFTRMYDFGFSKNAEETFTHWPKNIVLGDVVRVMRAFRPHVVVAFFSGTPRDGHGHHQVSGIVAREAYDAAADTVAFPADVYGAPWTPQKFYRSARQDTSKATLRMNVGEYNPLLGRSYFEIAADSRSQHKSQGFGVLQRKGTIIDAVTREHSRAAAPADASTERSLFDGVDTTWARLKGHTSNARARLALDTVALAVSDAKQRYRADQPTPTIEPLARALRSARLALGIVAPSMDAPIVSVASGGRTGDGDAELVDGLTLTISRLERALVLAAGVAVEATAAKPVFPVREFQKRNVNDSLVVDITLFNRGRSDVTLQHARIDPIGSSRRIIEATMPEERILPDSARTVSRYAIAYKPTTSWWRGDTRVGDWFPSDMNGMDEATRQAETAVNARARIAIAGVPVDVVVPVVNRFADPVKGDQQVPVAAVPGITIAVGRAVEYIRAGVPVQRLFQARVLSAYPHPVDVQVKIQLPNGLKADSMQRDRTLTPEAPMVALSFVATGNVPEGRLQMGAIANHQRVSALTGYYTIEYDHITPQREYTPSGKWLAGVSVKLPPRARVGYVPGVGDNGIEALEQLDIPVEVLDRGQIAGSDLSRFSSIVVGPRAYEASKWLPEVNGRLLDYARRGGTLVVQYGQYEMLQPGIMPYPLTLKRPAERVTSESAPITVLQPTAPLLTTPNRITPADWQNWIQERAIYMPSTAAPQYRSFLQMNDPDEAANRNALLQADVGKGKYVYVTLALFRQLPNGVPGAARLLMNIIAGDPPATKPKM